jgi:hypothetical protein
VTAILLCDADQLDALGVTVRVAGYLTYLTNIPYIANLITSFSVGAVTASTLTHTETELERVKRYYGTAQTSCTCWVS